MTRKTLVLRWKIFDQEGIECGGFEHGPQGTVVVDGSIPALRDLLDQASANGLLGRQDRYIEDDQKWVLCSIPLDPSEQSFSFAFADFVGSKGFRVVQEHPETLEAFRALLTDIPDQEQQELITQFQSLSYLQQTAVLEELSDQERKQE